MCRAWHLAFLYFMMFAWANLSSPWSSLWMASLLSSMSIALHSLVSSANLLRVHSVPLSVFLTKMLNNTGPYTDPWGMPLITGFHLDIEPFITTFWVQPSSQFLIFCVIYPSIKSMSLQFKDKDFMWDSVTCSAQVQVDDVCCCSLIHQCSNPIIEGHQICQAQFALTEAMLAVTSPPVISLFSMCLYIVSSRICSMILPGTEVRLTGPTSAFLSFLNTGLMSPVLQSLGTSLDCHHDWHQKFQSNSSAFGKASWQVALICNNSPANKGM